MSRLPGPALELAQKQFGVLARRQLRRWLPRSVIDGHVRRGAFVPVERGVYRVTGGVVVPGQRALAATLRARNGAVVTGPMVLGRLGIEGFDLDSPFEVLLPPGRALQNVGFPARIDPFPTRPVTKLGDVRLAGKIDALLESCLWRSAFSDRQLRVAYHQLRYRHGVTTAKVGRRLEARGDHDPAVVAFLEVVEDEPAPESEGERALAPFLRRLRPAPEAQVWVTPKRRVDWYLRPLRFGWEYLGAVDHAYASERRADAARDEELAAQGIRLQYVTAADLVDATAFLATMVGALAVRADQLGVDAVNFVAAS